MIPPETVRYCVAGDFSKVDHVVYERLVLRLPLLL